MKQHLILDTEIIGSKQPHFLVKCKVHETGERFAFWHHKKGHTAKLEKLLLSNKYTVVTFNGENFDRPLLAAAIAGYHERDIKQIAQAIIDEELRSWQTYREFNLDFIEYDHIDIKEVPPGVMLSLKVYEGRMHSPNLQDMPFDHFYDLKTPKEFKIVEDYCDNDISETERLFTTVRKEIELRIALGDQYDLELRSKSDAQAAEAVLKKVCGIGSKDKIVPRHVEFRCPDFIQTDSPQINALIDKCQDHLFKINHANGSPEFPDFLTEPLVMNGGIYQFGIGGLHSKHDIRQYVEASSTLMVSDIDAAGYYPKIIMEAGLIPNLGGGKGDKFLEAYSGIYTARIAAKRAGDKRTANTLKILLNGTYGKLGSIYCSFYAPELMLAVCLIGQLNLLCLIWELEKIKGVYIGSANTDGIMICYPPSKRAAVIKVVQANAKMTGFEYEETPYSKVAMRDVNSYTAITEEREKVIVPPKGKVQIVPASPPEAKRKGAYAKAGVMENVSPTFQICAEAVTQYLLKGTPVEDTIKACGDIREFISIRGVTGGGVQHTHEVEVDDWVLIKDFGSAKTEWMRQKWLDNLDKERKPVKRKSRPASVIEGRGGTPFGRVARWYMTTKELPPITYVKSGNAVAGTKGGKLCMQLPDKLPADLDYDWYINKAKEMLGNAAVPGYEEFASKLTKAEKEELDYVVAHRNKYRKLK
jgi:hypothetical protein